MSDLEKRQAGREYRTTDTLLVRIAERPLVVAALFLLTAIFPWVIYLSAPALSRAFQLPSTMDLIEWLPVPVLFLVVNGGAFFLWMNHCKNNSHSYSGSGGVIGAQSEDWGVFDGHHDGAKKEGSPVDDGPKERDVDHSFSSSSESEQDEVEERLDDRRSYLRDELEEIRRAKILREELEGRRRFSPPRKKFEEFPSRKRYEEEQIKKYEDRNEFPSRKKFEDRNEFPSRKKYEEEFPSRKKFEDRNEYPSRKKYEEDRVSPPKEFEEFPSRKKYEDEQVSPLKKKFEDRELFLSKMKYEDERVSPPKKKFQDREQFPSRKKYEEEHVSPPKKLEDWEQFPSRKKYEEQEQVSPPKKRYEEREQVSPPKKKYEERERVSPPKKYEERERVSPPKKKYEERERVSPPKKKYEERERDSPPKKYEEDERASPPKNIYKAESSPTKSKKISISKGQQLESIDEGSISSSRHKKSQSLKLDTKLLDELHDMEKKHPVTRRNSSPKSRTPTPSCKGLEMDPKHVTRRNSSPKTMTPTTRSSDESYCPPVRPAPLDNDDLNNRIDNFITKFKIERKESNLRAALHEEL